MKLKNLSRLFQGNRRGKQEELDHRPSNNRCIPFSVLCGGKDKPVIETREGTTVTTQLQNRQQLNNRTASHRARAYKKQNSNSPTHESRSESTAPKLATSVNNTAAPLKSESQSLPIHPSRTSKSSQITQRKSNPFLKHSTTQKMSSQRRSSKSGTYKESILEEQATARMYDLIPPLEVTQLPRGGISIETKAIGSIQVSRFGNQRTQSGKKLFSTAHRSLIMQQRSSVSHPRPSKIACF